MKLNIKSKAYIKRLLKLKRQNIWQQKKKAETKRDVFGVRSCNEEIQIINDALNELEGKNE